MKTKKEYESPVLLAEEYHVADYISSCSVQTTINQVDNCDPPEGNLDLIDLYYMIHNVFTEACEISLDEVNFKSYCYHTPAGQDIVFTS